MLIEINGYEGPDQMRAVATLLETLAKLTERDSNRRLGEPGDLVATKGDDGESFTEQVNETLAASADAAEWLRDLSTNTVHVEPPVLQDLPTPPATTPELDSAGQEWNAELHSSSRAFVADGTWRKRRNVAMPPPPSAPDTQVELPIPPPPLVSTQPTTFAELMDLTQGLLAEKKITPQDIMAAVIECGLPSMAAMSLPENARLIPTIARMVLK